MPRPVPKPIQVAAFQDSRGETHATYSEAFEANREYALEEDLTSIMRGDSKLDFDDCYTGEEIIIGFIRRNIGSIKAAFDQEKEEESN